MDHQSRQARRRPHPDIIVGVVLGVLALAAGAQAQERGAPLATINLSFDGRYTANDPDADERDLSTRLGFTLSRSTQTQSFSLATDGNFLFDETGFSFERPGLNLGYGWQNRSTAIDFGLNYSVTDVEGTTDVIDPITLNVTDLINDDGTLETLSLSAGLITGRDARFGTQTRFSFIDRTYSGTSDPSLTDLTSWEIGTTLRFDVTPRIGLRNSASYREIEEDDRERTVRRITRFGVAGDLLIDRLWSGTFALDYSISETEEDNLFGGRILTEEDRHSLSLGATRRFKDGTLGISFARNLSDAGVQDSLQISRSRDFRNGTNLAVSLGLVVFPNGDTSPIFSAAYAFPTPRGGFSAGIQQVTQVDADDESVISTTANFSYDQAINAVSSWSVNGNFTNVRSSDDNATGQSRAQVGLSYQRALNRDWSLTAALRHRVDFDSGEEDSSASTLSLSLGRSFSFRP